MLALGTNIFFQKHIRFIPPPPSTYLTNYGKNLCTNQLRKRIKPLILLTDSLRNGIREIRGGDRRGRLRIVYALSNINGRGEVDIVENCGRLWEVEVYYRLI